MYTYAEAKKIAEERHDAERAYYESCGSPLMWDEVNYAKYMDNMPEGVYNYNQVSRCNGVMLVGESTKGFYEYPSGLMAWGGPIPDEAYVSQEDLEKTIWDVRSIVMNYSDW